MDAIVLILFLLVIPAIFAFVCYKIAIGKNRSGGLWAVLGFIFGLIALIIVAVLPKSTPSTPPPTGSYG